MRRFLILVLVVAASVPISGSTVGAACIAPYLEFDGGQVAAGDQIAVTGQSWGDQCYDTGPPPEGQGFRGFPTNDITVLLVQGETEIVVAEGSADAAYAFRVTVTVPSDLRVGQFRIIARSSDGNAGIRQPFRMAFIDGGPATSATIAPFDPSDAVVPEGDFPESVRTVPPKDTADEQLPAPTQPEPTSQEEAIDDLITAQPNTGELSRFAILVALAGGMAVVLAIAVVLIGRRSQI